MPKYSGISHLKSANTSGFASALGRNSFVGSQLVFGSYCGSHCRVAVTEAHNRCSASFLSLVFLHCCS